VTCFCQLADPSACSKGFDKLDISIKWLGVSLFMLFSVIIVVYLTVNVQSLRFCFVECLAVPQLKGLNSISIERFFFFFFVFCSSTFRMAVLLDGAISRHC
jgi:hypothetical protein